MFITSDQFPHAQPGKLMHIIHELRAIEQDIEFQAAMSSNIHTLSQQTRSELMAEAALLLHLKHCHASHLAAG